MPTPPPYPWDAFKDGDRFVSGGRLVQMICREVGSICLPTGRIVACDPLTNIHTHHFNHRVELECYAVFLAVADDGNDQRVAAAMILFADGATPIRWELATEAGSDPRENNGYSVDSGRGCFLDLKLARNLYRKAELRRLDSIQRRLASQMDENEKPTWSWANVVLDEVNGANLIAFTTGAGDGSYMSFFGFSDIGRLVCLITDFGLLDQRDVESSTAEE